MTESDQNTAHIETLKLLPWYINESISKTEKLFVEEHLRNCLTCRIEREQLQQFGDQVKYSEDLKLIHKQPYLQLRSRIRQSENDAEHSPQSPRSIKQAANYHWFHDLCGRLLSPVFLKAASFILFFALMIFIVIQQNTINPTVMYKTLSASKQSAGNPNSDIRVVFKTGTSIDQIREIVASLDVHLVEGPSDAGVYRLRIKPGSPKSNESLKAMIKTLRHRTNVVFAEPGITASSTDFN